MVTDEIKYYGVITGTIINNKNIMFKLPENFELYNGRTGFQSIVSPENALKESFKIYFSLKTLGIDSKISIGIGNVYYLVNKVGECDGEAFRYSSEGLKYENIINIITPWFSLNNEFKIETLLLNSFSEFWTPNQIESLNLYFNGYTQKEISKILNISQSAIQQRLKNSKYHTINLFINYYEDIINNIINGKKNNFKSFVGSLPAIKREKRLYCERCRENKKLLHWHHWNDNYTNFGLWLCPKCHRVAEETEHKKIIDDKYMLLKKMVENNDIK